MNKTVNIDFNLPDPAALRYAGLIAPQMKPACAQAGAVPSCGDFLRFADLNYASGELAIFRVLARTHLFATDSHRIQIELELVVAHQP